MKAGFFLFALFQGFTVFGQSPPTQYGGLVRKADSLYNAGVYRESANLYSAAFKVYGGKGLLNDRYNAACSWALAGVADSAFSQLERLAKRANYTNLSHISADADLKDLHTDSRWKPLIDIIRQNKEKAEVNLNKPLAARLDSIYADDQNGRHELNTISKQYGWESKEMKALVNSIGEKDSVNLLKVKAILDKHGWLGTDVVGEQGNSALFLVIQHADLAIQEKYLPMMREAVKAGKARGSSLALLEDRVALRQGKRQIYGSQVSQDPQTHVHFISPLDDPDHVDERRADVGLPPLADYVSHWQIKWDVDQYKKDLPELEKKLNAEKPRKK